MAPVKILVTGSINGQFAEVFSKVKTLNEKHGPFDVQLCTGNLFGPDQDDASLGYLLQNKVEVPLMTYFIAGDRPLPPAVQSRIDANDGEVCANLYYLGKRGTLTTASGLKIAFLSGVAATVGGQLEASKENKLIYTEADIKALQAIKMPVNLAPGVDILLTHEWPSGIEKNSSVSSNIAPAFASDAIVRVTAATKPRYHFAAAEQKFYEREPYKNITGFGPPDERPAEHVTRFIGLGDALNNTRQRWFYAFNMEPLSRIDRESLASVPANTTECPFVEQAVTAGQKRPLDEEADALPGNFLWGGQAAKRQATSQEVQTGDKMCRKCGQTGHIARNCPSAGNLPADYVCRVCQEPGHHIRDCPERGRRGPPPLGYACNICQRSDHYISECPSRRRSLRPDDLESCWFCLANPKVEKHLIVSIGNEMYATLAKGPVVQSGKGTVPGGGHVLLVPITHYPTFRKIPVESQVEVVAEIEKYKNALRRLYERYDHDMLVFEVSRESFRGLSHAHLQIVPIPKDKSAQIEEIAKAEAEQQGFQFTDKVPDNPDLSYFKLDLPNDKTLVHIIQPNERFNIQCGRLIAAKVLGHPEREDWKSCKQTEKEERKDAEAFKKAFKEIDFTN